MSRSTLVLLGAGAVLLAANLVASVANTTGSAPRDAEAGPTNQACCFPQHDGECRVLTPGDCLLVGGMPQGPGTHCAAVSCLPGACCLPFFGEGFFCVGEGLTETVCVAIGGTFGGQGSKCIEVGCTVNLCPSDVTGDGTVGINDFLQVLADWGACQ